MRRIGVERRAEQLLERFGVSHPPADPWSLAADLGVEVREESFPAENEDVSGVLYRRPKGDLILINRDNAHVRHRFTIAHEIGHLSLHDDDVYVERRRDGRSSLATDREEIEANQFAAALLMPRAWIEREAAAQGPVSDDDLIHLLADRFEVSKEAMEYRLRNLGILEIERKWGDRD